MSERDALSSLRRYTRFTLLTTVPIVGLAPLLVTFSAGQDLTWLWLPAAGTVLLLAVHWGRLAQAINLPTEVLPTRPSMISLVAAFALACFAYVFVGPGNVLWLFLPATAIAELQYGRQPQEGWRNTAALAAAGGALVAVLASVAPGVDASPVAAGLVTALLLLVLPYAEIVALRQWRLAVELDQARRDAAELGATRERLRIAEDLHDILGHALEVVSLKSELATRISTVDPTRATEEMAEVQRLARGALRDVRQLARGRRSTDLETELTGARTLLTSAGIECVVDGVPDGGRHSELFGRVLREAVTNMLRHADTSRCWIIVRPDALTVVNDGVEAGAAPGDGTGLAGLRRRVAEAGGELTAGPGKPEGTFMVVAMLT